MTATTITTGVGRPNKRFLFYFKEEYFFPFVY